MKIAQGIRSCGRFLISNFGKLSLKISVLGILYPYHCTEGSEIWHGGGPNFTPIGAMCRPCGAKNLKIGL